MKNTIYCQWCKKPITYQPYKGKKFCSYECRDKARYNKALKEFICETCGKVFVKKKRVIHGVNKNKYCSNKCAKDGQARKVSNSVEVSCSRCGKELILPMSKILKNKKHFFCNKECRDAFFVGENNPAYVHGVNKSTLYGPNWGEQNRKARKRDDSRCQVCGKKPKIKWGLHVHHIQPVRTFNGDYRAANRLTNLVCLCSGCHRKVEAGKIAVQPKLL